MIELVAEIEKRSSTRMGAGAFACAMGRDKLGSIGRRRKSRWADAWPLMSAALRETPGRENLACTT